MFMPIYVSDSCYKSSDQLHSSLSALFSSGIAHQLCSVIMLEALALAFELLLQYFLEEENCLCPSMFLIPVIKVATNSHQDSYPLSSGLEHQLCSVIKLEALALAVELLLQFLLEEEKCLCPSMFLIPVIKVATNSHQDSYPLSSGLEHQLCSVIMLEALALAVELL
ncbi:hypothetical protein AVEN_146699-1 [Araneus ventricosus]|uniref:Uncharacterized protein n=1 Tax=Araneus ventricosus TaxID=182803 RepID=A0A4Y2MVG5_ARAVE|nr:hypothetical protein AVEN_146699-1 [Araneus ventricosus]